MSISRSSSSIVGSHTFEKGIDHEIFQHIGWKDSEQRLSRAQIKASRKWVFGMQQVQPNFNMMCQVANLVRDSNVSQLLIPMLRCQQINLKRNEHQTIICIFFPKKRKERTNTVRLHVSDPNMSSQQSSMKISKKSAVRYSAES